VLTTGDPSQPTAELSRSAELSARIRARAATRGGWLPFSEFMEAALYEPGLGYYMIERPIFGAAGDFVTAPEMSPLFAACLANGVASLLGATEGGDIVELGAGSGVMAAQLFAALERSGRLLDRYRIVEPSPVLTERQQRLVSNWPGMAPHFSRFEWLEAPPSDAWQGVALANEVVDALPVDRFRIAGRGCDAIGVATAESGFEWRAGPADARLSGAVGELQARLPQRMQDGFVSELRLAQREWVASATATLTRGAMLVVDYGLPRAQYYHPSRDGGTLCGFRQHLRVEDPLAMPGAQDLTAWVDFSALADESRAAGLEVGGFATQAHYLLSVGIERELARLTAEGVEERDRWAHRKAASSFLLPGEMGERFKVMALVRGIRGPIHGFEFRDLSASL
jgi:SAM-dependent MidA family methyltransferase